MKKMPKIQNLQRKRGCKYPKKLRTEKMRRMPIVDRLLRRRKLGIVQRVHRIQRRRRTQDMQKDSGIEKM